MQLARILSSAENSALTTKLQELNIAGVVWLGGASEAQSGSTFAWLDSTIFLQNGRAVPGVYQNFARNQPVVVNFSTNLVISTANDGSAGTWLNASPGKSEPFVCEAFAP